MRASTLPELKKQMTKERIRKYAEVSEDFNPLHLDPAFAATTPYGRPIAHGMLFFGFLTDMMAAAFGPAWPQGGRIRVRFRAPVFPGDTVTTYGTLKAQHETDKGLRLEYLVGLRNQHGEEVASGEAEVVVPTGAPTQQGA